MEFNLGNHKFAIENKLVQKLDIMINRCTREKIKQDAYLQNEGKPGEGKTNAALVEAFYVKLKTGRTIHLFFGLDKFIKFYQTHSDGLLIWDEPSLNALRGDHATRIARDLTRLVNMGRMKRHFCILNFTKFWKFPEDMVVDTCLGMVHLDSKDGRDPGRFKYIPRKKLEKLWNDYVKKKKKAYSKYKRFHGVMPHIIERLDEDGKRLFDLLDITVEGVPHCTYEMYQQLKARSIESIGDKDKKKDKNLEKLMTLRYKIANVKGITRENLASQLGIASTRLREWSRIDLNAPFSRENEGFEPTTTHNSNITGVNQDEPDQEEPEEPWIEEDDDITYPIVTNKPKEQALTP